MKWRYEKETQTIRSELMARRLSATEEAEERYQRDVARFKQREFEDE